MDTTFNKAIVAWLLTAISVSFALMASLAADGDLSTLDWILIGAAFFGPSSLNGFLTYLVGNKQSPDPTTSTPGPFPGGSLGPSGEPSDELVQPAQVFVSTVPPPISARRRPAN